jgi:hypothetical protein
VKLRTWWRAFRLRRGWIQIDALRGEGLYARLRAVMRG